MMKEYVYSDLFKLLPQPFKVSKLDFVVDGKTPAYSSDTRNNGCVGFVDKEPLFKVTKEIPAYLVFGDHTRTMNIVREGFCVMDNVKVLSPLVTMSDEVLLYITTCWKKAIPNLGYARHWSVAKTIRFELPVIASSDPNHVYTVDDIDWQYMQDRIAELEQDRIAELEAYLAATGLDDYELTDEDKTVLESASKFAEFKVCDVFRIVNPKGKLTTRELLDGSDISYVAAKKTNNGVAKVCSKANIPDEQIMAGNCIVFVKQGDGAAGYTTYQPDDFYAIPCVCAGYIDGHLNEQTGAYLVAVLDKNRPLYGHSNSWGGDKLYNTVMNLPVIPHADPNHTYTVADIDWHYMERYICAMEKIAIADVVEYKDKVIDTTKTLVNA